MPFDKDDKDEIRKIVATEIRDFVKSAVNAALNRPIELTEMNQAMTPEGMKEREAQKKIVQQFGAVIIKAAERNWREAEARIIEKTDHEAAERFRKLDPTF